MLKATFDAKAWESASPEAAADALERISTSPEFARSHRLARFLRFTVAEALSGNAIDLSERAIGTHVYDRPLDFDPKIDGIVRGEARRLRKKLAQYYAREGKSDPVVIEYRKGSYVPRIYRRPQSEDVNFLTGGGETAERALQFDWSSTPLGPIDRWPPALRTTLSFCQRSPLPVLVFWGRDLLMFYNDAATSLSDVILPHALGRPAKEALGHPWLRFRPILEAVMNNRSPVDLTAERFTFRQETRSVDRYFNVCFVPVSETGDIAGVIVSMFDVTQFVVSERRLRTLQGLTARASAVEDLSEACRAFAAGLRDNPADIPFACIYAISEDAHIARLEAAVHIEAGTALSPLTMTLDRGSFSLGGMNLRVEMPGVFDLGRGYMSLVPSFPETGRLSIVVLPIYSSGIAAPSGMLLIGLNEQQRFEGTYRNFLELVGGQLGRTFSEAHAKIREKRLSAEIASCREERAEFYDKAGAALREPLMLLTAPLQQLDRMDGATPFNDHQWVRAVQHGGTQIIRILDALRDYSAIEAATKEARYEPTDLALLTGRAAETFRSVIERVGIRFLVDCPLQPEPAYVDSEIVEKVVLNLVSNAFEHTVEGEIRVTLRMIGEQFILEVADTGTGIDEADRGRLFNPFQNSPRPGRRSRRGLGMGLSLSRAFLGLHGGSLRIVGELGHGNRLTAYIPRGKAHLSPGRIGRKEFNPWTRFVAQAPLDEAEGWIANQTETVRRVTESEKRVILAEHNSDLREYLLELLSGTFATEAASDTEQALALVRSNPPDLVFMESSLPTQGGTALIEALRADPATRAVPVILLTEDSDEEFRLKALAAGADDLLLKPFSTRELMLRAISQIQLRARRRD